MFKLIPNSVWQLLKDELEAKRDDVRRLTEALARQNGVAVQLSKDIPPTSPIPSTSPDEYIASPGWFDKKPFPTYIPPRKD